MADEHGKSAPRQQSRFMMSLRDALAAARRSEGEPVPEQPSPAALPPAMPVQLPPPPAPAGSARNPAEIAPPVPSVQPEVRAMPPKEPSTPTPPPLPSAAEAARAARGEDRPRPANPVRHIVADTPETAPDTRGARREAPAQAEAARTVLVRGKPKIERGTFGQDPVVGWVVVVGGPGLGAFRPIFEGNNTLGRAGTQRVPIDFGDDMISSEEQAYIRYDSDDRSFLFVPNLAKTNIVEINGKKPTAAVPLSPMDVIRVGRTQLAFVPFCGPDFDWGEFGGKG